MERSSLNSLKKSHASKVAAACAVLVGAVALQAPAQAATPADSIYYGGRVLTVDKAFSVKSAVAVKDGKILAVGGPELLRNYEAPTKVDLKGRTLMPGFMYTHMHIM